MNTHSNPTDLLPLVGLGAEQPWPRGAARLELVACVQGREIWSASTQEGETVSVTTFAAEPTAAELEALGAVAAGLSEVAEVPGVVRLLESNTRRGYIVTEPIVGTLKDSPALGLKLDRKLELMQALCASVESLHELGRCHGELRPEIIGLLDDLAPKLLDAGGRPSDTTSSRVYAAPEVLAGDPPDARSDVYSLGRILAFLALGADPPDEAENVPRLDCLARAPAGISRIVRRATCAEPLLRYSGVGALAGDLAHYGDFDNVGLMLPSADEQNFTGLSSPPVSSRRNAVIPIRYEPGAALPSRRSVAGLAAAMVVVALGATMLFTNPVQRAAQWWARRGLASPDPAQRGIAALRLTELGDRELGGANLEGADLVGGKLAYCALGGANLSRAKLDRADLAGADLKGASLGSASALGTDFSGADLEGTTGFRTVSCDDQTTPPQGWACRAGQLAPSEEMQ